jgi:hypothetical protein
MYSPHMDVAGVHSLFMHVAKQELTAHYLLVYN